MNRLGLRWQLHGDGRNILPGAVVAPDERLSWPRTLGIGAQHIVAMFGATFLVPIITGMPPATTLFFSGIGTMIFLLLTAGKIPSYLGSSFAFIAPIMAASASGGPAVALGGVVLVGLALFGVGLLVQWLGSGWIEKLMPPVVTGTIVALIGLNLAPAAKKSFDVAPGTALITLVTILVVMVLFRGMISRLAILIGVLVGYLAAMAQGQVDFSKIEEAAWIGLPQFQSPSFNWSVLGLFLPVVLVLVAENIGHVKSVALMTGHNLDPVTGRALMADGAATALAGLGGGSGTTTYAENIGVMAATKVYSTAAYWVAAAGALLLSFSPKFGAMIASVPVGVIGGVGTILYGMIGILGVRIWLQHTVNFSDPVNLSTAAVPLVIGIADYTWVVTMGDTTLTFAGIALGTVSALVIYHGMRGLQKLRGEAPEQNHPTGSS